MSRLFLLGVLAVAIVGASRAAPTQAPAPGGLVIDGEVSIVVTKLPFRVLAPNPNVNSAHWRYPDTWVVEEGKSELVVKRAPEGTYTVRLRTLTIDFEKKLLDEKAYKLTFSVGKMPDPGPGPNPPPPPPPPPPSDDPFGPPAGGLRVLMLYDSAQKTSYTQAQLNVLEGAQVRDYLEAHCGQDPRVSTWKAYRIWGTPVDASKEHALWQKVLARPRASLPWIVIGNGKAGYEGALPADPDSALTLLKKYGGG